jgi:hypothetical protein
MNELENHILKLHECLNSAHAGDVAKSMVSDIVYICGENISPQTIGMIIHKFKNWNYIIERN